MRVREDVPSLRRRDTFPVVRAAIALASKVDFSIVHFSAQSNHIHLIVEAKDAIALWKGMQGLAIRIARAVNRVHGRRGTVWADRYHAHELKTPTETHRALSYVVFNHQHHTGRTGPDPCSSSVMPPRTWLVRTGWRRALL